ncbi:hypothetical protein TNCV_2852931 [Trichonephila clavipes]|uniref:Uncharacterized protein n=1 Tax=Trichonephila clavipes TaxID=2585209 RepID=A0A8X6UV62_TRICX|nr:hypothetical protein TNCV_2852931 [Trichonephila clavipes]
MNLWGSRTPPPSCFSMELERFLCEGVNRLQWLATVTAMPLGLGLNPGEDMDVYDCIVISRQEGTLNSRGPASPLVRLVELEERWEAPDHPSVLSLKIVVKPS